LRRALTSLVACLGDITLEGDQSTRPLGYHPIPIWTSLLDKEQTSLTKRTRQVVILTVGSMWKAPYELYAHSAIAANVAMNGSCLLSPNVLLAGGATSLIWRVDLPEDGKPATARIWMAHDNMKMRPGEKKPEQPGVNGVRYAARTGYLYYTSTSQQLMMRVSVDQDTLEPAGPPEFVAGGRYWDDFVLDEDAGIAYVTTHRENTIDRVEMQADGNRAGFVVAAGNPFTETLIGPSSGVWDGNQAIMDAWPISQRMEGPRSHRMEFCERPKCCE